MRKSIFLSSMIVQILSSFWHSTANAEPVQFCKFGNPDHPDEQIDFCLGALQYNNVSSNSYDMYLTVTVARSTGSSLGWTAVGAGSIMEGSLMFIIYGDPLSKEDPIVSIRTADGHHQPTLLVKSDMRNRMDLRVIRSSWLTDDSYGHGQSSGHLSHTAVVSLVCYSCEQWRGADISAESKSQPWIWAWNAKQEFDVFSFDAHLKMHKHHAGAGGWGNFYLDMSRSISTARFPPSLPPIRPNMATLGSSDLPMSFSDSFVQATVGPGSFFHGLVMAVVFTLIFPAGVIGLRNHNSKSFKYHWILQLVASILLLLGLGLGLAKQRRINTIHQWVGIAVAMCTGVQGLFGYWHHKRFVRLQQRTWVSHVHISLGRLMMVAGWTNIVTGLCLRGLSKKSPTVIIAIVVVSLQAVSLSAWVFWVQQTKIKYTPKPMWAKEGELGDDGEGSEYGGNIRDSLSI